MRRVVLAAVAVATAGAVAALAGCGVTGITSTGVVAFGAPPSGAASDATSVPAGDTAYQVYFQIGDTLQAEPRVTQSGKTTEELYAWLIGQIALGPNASELARGFSPPDRTLSGIQMLKFTPTGQAATAMVNRVSALSGNDEGQIICTLNGQNLGILPDNDAFGIVYPTDPTTVNWNNCSSFPLSGASVFSPLPS